MDDITGVDGTHLSFTYRVSDSRSGRFLSVDPLTTKYPWNSPYSFSMNRLIDGVEYEGLEVVLVHGDGRISALGTAAIQVGVAADFEGNVGLFFTPSVGAGYIGGYSLGGGFTVFPTLDRIDEVKKWGMGVLVSGIFGAGASGGLNSTLDFEKNEGELGGTIGFGVGIEVGAAWELSYTFMSESTWEEVGDYIADLPDELKRTTKEGLQNASMYIEQSIAEFQQQLDMYNKSHSNSECSDEIVNLEKQINLYSGVKKNVEALIEEIE